MVRHRCKQMLALLMSAAMLRCATPVSAAANGYTVSVSDGVDGKNTIEVGETLAMDVRVSGAAFNGMQAEIKYSPSVLQLESVTGCAVSSEETPGTVDLYVLSDPECQADTVVATLYFKAVEVGETDVAIEYATAGTYEHFWKGDAVKTSVKHDSIKVVEACRLDKKADGTYTLTMSAVPKNTLVIAAGYHESGKMMECCTLARGADAQQSGGEVKIDFQVEGALVKVFFMNEKSCMPEREMLIF